MIETTWTEKYRPKSINDMALLSAKIHNQKVDLINELKSFIMNFFKLMNKINQKNKKIRAFNRTANKKQQKDLIRIPTDKKAVLLEGNAGIGKTSVVYALANDLNLKVIETNASDTRTSSSLEKKLKETSKSRDIMDFLKKPLKKIILVDEVDGIYGNRDKGAVPTILKLIDDSQFPIIMCANEYKSNLKPIYKSVSKFEVFPLSKNEIIKVIKKVLKSENINKVNPKDIDLIITKNHGDLRAIINDLQAYYQSNIKIDTKFIDSLKRDSTEEIFKLVRTLFQNIKTLKEAKQLSDKSDVDYNFLYRWINENIPSFIIDKEAVDKAYENLSFADEIYGKIRKDMNWSLLPYFYDLFLASGFLSSDSNSKGFKRIAYPRYRSSKKITKAEQKVIEKIRIKYELSNDEIIQDLIPFIQNLTSDSRRRLKKISDFFDLNAQEKKLLSKK